MQTDNIYKNLYKRNNKKVKIESRVSKENKGKRILTNE